MQPNRQRVLMSTARATASFRTEYLTSFIRDWSALDTAVFIVGFFSDRYFYEYFPLLNEYQSLIKPERSSSQSQRIVHCHDSWNPRLSGLMADPRSSFLTRLHQSVFYTTIRLQGSKTQQEHWLPLVKSGGVAGTYLEAELGHGSLLEGIETTATFRAEADDFVLDSPTITSWKRCSGGPDANFTHAIVAARLFVRSQDYGVHFFIVPMKMQNQSSASLVASQPSPGIGISQSSIVQSCEHIVFRQIHVPRTAMLMRLAETDEKGTYASIGNIEVVRDKVLLSVRQQMIQFLSVNFASAVTIATRYSVTRTQDHGTYAESPIEVPILSSKSQHARLLLYNSQAYALFSASEACIKLCQREGPCRASYSHALTCALKAYTVRITADGIAAASRCCGFLGTATISGMPTIMARGAMLSTLFEGNDVDGMLYHPMARYLMQFVADMRHGKSLKDEALDYISRAYKPRERGGHEKFEAQDAELAELRIQLSLFQYRAARLIMEVESLLARTTAEERMKLGHRQAWNEHAGLLEKAVQAHIEVFVLTAFMNQQAQILDQNLGRVMGNVCSLFALETILSKPDFCEAGFFDEAQAQAMRKEVRRLHRILLPEAIALTDAWAFRDEDLDSAIGAYDGNIYERLKDRAKPMILDSDEDVLVMSGGRQPSTTEHIKAKL